MGFLLGIPLDVGFDRYVPVIFIMLCQPSVYVRISDMDPAKSCYLRKKKKIHRI
jgi:hypothetical protein